ncbi:MAG: putative signal-transduction protein containing cAMP-binding and domain [Bacilli bacterium]|nr:putative signal-transduction protein containing cAMP-binding and domain [Bacilli bacterium]
MKLRELMTQRVETCHPRDSITKAAKLMQAEDVGMIPICEGDKVVGCLTDRDIVLNIIANERDVNNAVCQDAMTSDVITGSPDMSANEAADLMARQKIRRLPIVENDRLIGICAIGDLAVISIHENEAGYALSEISEGAKSVL